MEGWAYILCVAGVRSCSSGIKAMCPVYYTRNFNYEQEIKMVIQGTPRPCCLRMNFGGNCSVSVCQATDGMSTAVTPLPLQVFTTTHSAITTCGVQDASDHQGVSIVTCAFPVNISFFTVSFFSAAFGGIPDVIISCHSCHVNPKFENMITLKFPHTTKEGDRWVFEVERSQETAGIYTCLGWRGPDSFQSTPCNITYAPDEHSAPTTYGKVASSNSRLSHGSSSNGSVEWRGLITIPLLVCAIIIIFCILYRRGLIHSPQTACRRRKQRGNVHQSLQFVRETQTLHSEQDQETQTRPPEVATMLSEGIVQTDLK